MNDTVLPEQLTRRQLSVRSFDRSEMMIDAAVIDGCDLELTIQRFFADTASNQIHVHSATRWLLGGRRRSRARGLRRRTGPLRQRPSLTVGTAGCGLAVSARSSVLLT